MGRCYLEHDIVGGSPLVLSLLRTALLQPSVRGILLGLSDWGLDIWLGSYTAGRLQDRNVVAMSAQILITLQKAGRDRCYRSLAYGSRYLGTQQSRSPKTGRDLVEVEGGL